MAELRQSRPKGTLDFVPPQSIELRGVEETFRRVARRFGFAEIITPTFEHTEVFVKSTGTSSDIVTKEMYRFRDRSDRDLTLRPEGTPSVVRAVLENNLRLPTRLFYTGSYFRYSRPQKGRYREFHQLGVEALGEAAPDTDAEVIFLGTEFFSMLGIDDCLTHVNSIGCLECRPAHRTALVAFFAAKRDQLCPDCLVRLEANPLRILDCKVEACRTAAEGAPAPRQFLCAACETHFQGVLTELTRRNLQFELDDRLVRGLDYYNRTTFEYVSKSLGAQDSLGGGGRYDYLVRSFGGPDTPGIGFALGLERTLLAMPPAEITARHHICYVIWMSEAELPAARDVADRLRAAGLPARIDYDAKKPAKQFKSADADNAACCVVIGADELSRGVYSLKDLATGDQTEIPHDFLVPEVRARFRD